MRLKLSTFCLFTIITALLVQEISAGIICEIFNTCPKTTTPPAPSESASASVMPSASSVRPSSSVAPSPIPSPTSIVSSIKPSSVVSSAAPTTFSSIASSTASPSLTSAPSTTIPSPSDSATPTPSNTESSGGSNLGVIIGSVCGFIAIIGAGFAYAFFSKTRKNNRNKRLYSETTDIYGNDSAYQPDPFGQNTRPSPALAASAVAAADSIHGHNNQWDHQGYNYGNMAPQPPMVAVAKQHDPYYSTGPAQMGYATDPNMNGYYNNSHQQYYDPNAAYYEQQQHYDHTYVDSQKQQYDPYAVPQHQSPVLNHNNNANLAPATTTTGSTVYSSPHSYPDENTPHTTANNTYR